MKIINTLKEHYIFKRSRYYMVALLLSCMVPLGLLAQEKTVRGHVTDSKGEPLPGASVLNKERKNGATTDINGSFSITASADNTLVISYIGFTTREIKVGANTTLTVKLTEASGMLNEVVVIGYGETRRKDLTGAVSSIKGQDIQNVAQSGLDQMLQGRVSGVTVNQNSAAPGGGVSVRIRGISSFSGTEPLYVIDGVIIEGNNNKMAISAAGDGESNMSAVNFLNPEDIESVDILKDASATAIYGARGSNGVVIITTKKGKAGQGKISFDGYRGVQSIASELDLLDLKGYAAYKNSIADFTGAARDPLFSNIDLLGSGTDWQKEIFRSASTQNYQLALSGGTGRTTYYISGNYYDQDGIVTGSGFERKSIRANIDNEVKPWLKLGLNATYGITDQAITLTNNANNNYSNVIAMTILQSPDVPVRNVDGTFGGPSDIEGLGAMGGANPVAQATTWSTQAGRNKLQSSIYVQAELLKNFTFRSTFGSDLNWNKSSYFMPTFAWGRVINATNTYRVQQNTSTYWNWSNVLTYRNRFGEDHDVTVMLGQETNLSEWDQISSSRSKFSSNELYSLNLGDPATASSTEALGRSAMGSYFGRAIYSYKNRYALTGTLRRDRSSNFAPGHQVGYFPSVSASWDIANEGFMKSASKNISSLKLRGGYGEIGNQNAPQYAWGTALSPIFVNSSAFGTGLGQYVSNYPNPDLTWEHQRQWNVGLDVGLLSRFDLSLDVYNKISDKFLFRATYPATAGTGVPNSGTLGIAAPYVNAGKMRNKGIDLSLNYRTAGNKAFGWNSSLVISHFRNEVLELNSQTADITQTLSVNGNPPITKTIVGAPVGQFYGYQVAGLYQNADQLNTLARRSGNAIDAKTGTYLGDIIFKDLNNDGMIDGNDRTFIGDPNPDFTFGFTNNFSYKNFDLKVFLNGSYGNDIYNFTRVWGEEMTSTSGNQMASVLTRWTPENTDTDMPRYANGDPNQNAGISDRFIEDGSYLRIQNITLGYNFSQALAKRLKVVSNMRIYLSVQNAYTFTNYSGYDPEVGALNGNIFLNGVDLGRYPVARTYTFGINLGL